MMKNCFVVFLLSGLVAAAYGVTVPGTCPDFVTKQDFEVQPYLGTWFEIQRYEARFQQGMDCVQARYTLLDDGSVEVYNSGRDGSGNFTDIVGNAVVVGPGSLEVTFDVPGPPGSYNVLATDYVSFSSVYSCAQLGNFTTQYAWVLSRDAPLNDAMLAEAEEAFMMNGVDLSLFMPTYQGPDCPYPA